MDSIKLIDSSTNKLKMFKENILHEISTKWDSTFNENNAQNKSPKIIQRSKKNRSIYGQPQINLDPSTINIRNSHHWKSLDSLDFSESNHSNYSNSTSLSDLRTIDCQKNQDWIVSDIGTSVESFENEQESMFKRCSSMNSSSSGCSVTTENQDELSREAKYFMKQFVEKIFLKSSSISLEEKAKFGYYSRMENGRLWFARYINRKRNDNKCVQESTFYSLAQYFAIILFECAESDDFTPAKILMNMCFTFYHYQLQTTMTNNRRSKQSSSSSSSFSISTMENNKQYLCTVLRDQPIWKLKRFWNAAFFDAIQCERANFYENNRDQPNHKYYDWQFHANLTFGQLGTFTYNMNSFGLPKEFCLEFLRKQSTIANITNEQFKLLQDNIEAMYNAQK